MSRKLVLTTFFITVLIGTLNVAFDVQNAKASGTIHIRADGSIDPPTAPIRRNGNVYTLTGNITTDADGIIVERDNIVVDGVGYTVEGMMEGASESKGIDLSSRTNVTVTNIKITSFSYSYGIYLYSSSNNSISGNNITANWWGLLLHSSSNNSISGNNIANNAYGIRLFGSSNNTIAGNAFADGGLSVYDSYENLVEDNLVNDKPLVYLEGVSDVNVGYAGQVILVNCTNVTVENLDLSITSAGVQLIKTNNSRISGNTLARNGIGICLIDSLNNSVSGNDITNNEAGIWLGFSSNNSMNGNTITKNLNGILLDNSAGNSISENSVSNNSVGGIRLLVGCSSNSISGNNFINNALQASVTTGCTNFWDKGYPSSGNYWSDYNGTDLHSGPYQNETSSDGISDAPYTIDANNTDRYPLMGMFSDFKATSECRVQTICNSSISSFKSDGTSISFNVTGEDGTAGFCRICIPTALMNATNRVFVNGTEVPCNLLPCSNSTHSYLYFTYSHSTKEIVIIPELASLIILPLFMIATALAIIVHRKRSIKNRKTSSD